MIAPAGHTPASAPVGQQQRHVHSRCGVLHTRSAVVGHVLTWPVAPEWCLRWDQMTQKPKTARQEALP